MSNSKVKKQPEAELTHPEQGMPGNGGKNKKDSSRLTFSRITSISEALGENKSPKDVLQLILDAAKNVTQASNASLMTVESAEPESENVILRVQAAAGFKDNKILETSLKIGEGITGWVAENGIPLRVGNVQDDQRYIRVADDLVSELAVPLKIEGEVVGVISVDSTELNHFSKEHEALLLSLAAQSARVIQTSRLYQETQKRARELEFLIETSRELSGNLGLRKTLNKLLKMVGGFWDAPITAIFFLSPDEQTLVLEALRGASDAFMNMPPVPVANSLLGQVLEDDDPKPFLVEELEGKLLPPFKRLATEQHLKTMLAIPLYAEKNLGVLCLFWHDKSSYTNEQENLLTGLAYNASLAIQNAFAHQRILASEEAIRRSEKSALMIEMAGALAHEIRNPVTSIKILFQTALRPQLLEKGNEEDANMLTRQLERLESIVNSYLDSARSHKQQTNLEKLDLNEVVDDSLLLLATHAHEGTRMTYNLFEGELPLNGDSTQVSQIVYNLVLNALEAVTQRKEQDKESPRGCVQIKTGISDTDPNTIFLEVADNGLGLLKKNQNKLFKPFFTTKKKGVGLGLSIVKRIVEAHGGKLLVESPLDNSEVGCKFTVLLPRA